MITVEQNERLTRVGPGTPMGELFRRYWHPFAALGELDDRPTKSIRLLGEDLVLYRDRSGTLGLIEALCPHRRVDMSYGIPEEHGLRCMYHGWMFNETGQCIEQPFEETVHPDGRFKEKVKVTAYPVQELGGLLFTYMGPQPAPLLPNYDILAENDHVWREAFIATLPVNWLQCMENSVDPVHLEWLHGVYGAHTANLEGRRDVVAEGVATYGRHKKIGFGTFERGMVKRRVYGNTTEDDPKWTVGHPLLFPNILQQGGGGRYFFQYRVPVDDETTWHVELTSYWFPDDVEVPPQDSVPYQYVALKRPDGQWRSDDTVSQDHIAWILQGAIMDRSQERLGESDAGLIFYRKMLEDQMRIVEAGEEPINVVRNPAENVMIHNPQEGWARLGHNADMDEIARYGSPLKEPMREIIAKSANLSGLTA
jgi:5,5'-dehydrodivanillate O-demethylase oxygenase subunit